MIVFHFTCKIHNEKAINSIFYQDVLRYIFYAAACCEFKNYSVANSQYFKTYGKTIFLVKNCCVKVLGVVEIQEDCNFDQYGQNMWPLSRVYF